MSFTAFIRALFCMPAKPSSRRSNKARQQRRHHNQQPHKNAQVPPRRWCDPTEEYTMTTSLVAPAAIYQTRFRTNDLVPAKPLRKPMMPHAAPVRETVVSPRRVSPLSPRLPSPIPHIQASLDVGQVKEVIAIIGKSFPHFPCTVTGLAAMVHHGFRKRLPREVSVSFPAEYRDVARSWALSQGLLEVRGKRDCFGVVLSDGQIRCIKTRFLEHGFEDLRTVQAGDTSTPAKVLSLSTIAVQTAKAYVAELATADLWKQEAFADDMRWVLRAMEKSRQVLRPFYARDIVQHQFWIPFTLSFPDTVSLFANVGLGASKVEALQIELQRDAEIQCTLLAPPGNA